MSIKYKSLTSSQIKKGLCYLPGDIDFNISVRIKPNKTDIYLQDIEIIRKNNQSLNKDKNVTKQIKSVFKNIEKYRLLEQYLESFDPERYNSNNDNFVLHDLICYSEDLPDSLIQKSKEFKIWKHWTFNPKRVFITGFDDKNLEIQTKKKVPNTSLNINGTQFIFHKKNVDGCFILLELNNSEYIGIFDQVFKFTPPDNDKIIYASRGGSVRSSAVCPFLIGEKYTYLLSTWTGNYYVENKVMKAHKEIDPWIFFEQDLMKTAFKSLPIKILH